MRSICADELARLTDSDAEFALLDLRGAAVSCLQAYEAGVGHLIYFPAIKVIRP